MRPKNHIIICENCGKESAKRDKGKKYCSMECRIVPIKREVIGQTIGWLTILEELPRTRKPSGSPKRNFRCKCKCGEIVVKGYDSIFNKGLKTASCGCFMHYHATHNRIKHGMTKTPIYHVWSAMKTRCYKPNNPNYKKYGAKGITVCDRWLYSFDNFLQDMGSSYKRGLTLDRWPNKFGNYEPTNCRWATYKQQSRNLTTNRMVSFAGMSMCMADFEDALGVRAGYLRPFIKEKAAVIDETHPLFTKRNYKKVIKYYESNCR